MKSAGKGKLKKIIIWAAVALAVIVFVVVPIFGPLNPLEVLLLRIKYPVYSSYGLFPAHVDTLGPLNVEGAMMFSDTILHIRVTDQTETSGVLPDSSRWTAEVIEDPSGTFQPGESIWVVLSKSSEGKRPELQNGSEYLVMGGFDEDMEKHFHVNSLGMFYVTFTGHALAASDEGNRSFSGEKADVVVDTVYQIMQRYKEKLAARENAQE